MIDGLTVQDGSAALDGGGVAAFTDGGELTLGNSTAWQNTASSLGGGLCGART